MSNTYVCSMHLPSIRLNLQYLSPTNIYVRTYILKTVYKVVDFRIISTIE